MHSLPTRLDIVKIHVRSLITRKRLPKKILATLCYSQNSDKGLLQKFVVIKKNEHEFTIFFMNAIKKFKAKYLKNPEFMIIKN